MPFQDLYTLWQNEAAKCDRAHDYLTAKQTVRSTPVLAPPELRTLYYTPLYWCEILTQAIEERISITDVECSVERVAKWLRSQWRDIDGDLLSSRVHTEALAYGRAYVSVTTGEDGKPQATMLTAKSTVHKMNPRTGELDEALRVYGREGKLATLYQRGRTTWLQKVEGGWRVERQDDHGYSRVQIVVFSQRSAKQDGYGAPVTRSIWGLQDAGSRVSTDAAIAGALLAVPQRVIKGVTQDNKPKMSAEKMYLARLLTLSGKDASIEQFAAAQLQNFATLLNMYSKQAASSLGAPISLFGVASDANPASGDAKAEDDSRITRRAERIARDFTSSWELVLQLLLDFCPFPVTDEARRSATVAWLDPNKPTMAEGADMALKLASAKYGPNERPLVSHQRILKMLGLSDEEILAELDLIEEDELTALLREPVEEDPSVSPTGDPAPTGDPES